jgi:hypothetical protein
MFDLMQIGRWIIIAGIGLSLTGSLIYAAGKFGGLSSLPGTLRFEGSGLTCVVPILGSIILSIVLTVVLNLLARFFK